MSNSIGIFFAAMFSSLFAWSVWENNQRDLGTEEGIRYTSFLGEVNLPFILLVILIVSSFYYSLTESLSLIASTFFGAFLHMCIYNALMLAAMPFLRRKISARACGCLWMIPNILYMAQAQYMSPDHPLLVVPVPNSWLRILTVLWLSGFVAVFAFQLLRHFFFRHRILRCASAVQDAQVLELWKQAQLDAGLSKPAYRLLCSPAVRTPLSIGLWKYSTRVVLPHTDYTPEELRLIFRHELIHICRADACTKFSLVFCTAVCWFNPLMWISMRRSFDDLELSCDETVLLDADDDQRRLYADLLLRTAGQEQGFTTCLSASASALRYRLRNTVKPRKLSSGALTVGLVSFLLLITCGGIALAYDMDTGHHAIFLGQEPSDYSLTSVRDSDLSSHRSYIRRDPEQLSQYFSGLTVAKLTGSYDFMDAEHSLILLYNTANGTLGLDVQDNTINLTKFWGESIAQERLYVPGGLDWELLDRLLPRMPAAELYLTDFQGTSSSPASLDTVTQVCGAHSQLLLGPLPRDGSCIGTSGDIDFHTMALQFPEPPVAPIRVTFSSWDWSQSETIVLSYPDQVLELPSNDIHIQISTAFDGPDGSIYETVFRYDLQKNYLYQ